MRTKLSTVLTFSLVLLSSVPFVSGYDYLCNPEYSSKSEEEVMLSLLHVHSMLKKVDKSCPGLYRVCDCLKRCSLEEISEHDMRDVMGWMVRQLSMSKNHSLGNDEQQLFNVMRTFINDCFELGLKESVVANPNRGPCLSSLAVQSLEAYGVHVTGDLTVDGDIINSCCNGSLGLAGPTGPTGPTGLQGPPGTSCLTGANYLFATYYSSGYFGTNGNLVHGTDYLAVALNQEVLIPLQAEVSLTNGWASSAGSSVGFIVPKKGLYLISYDMSLVAIGYSSQVAVAWVARNNGTETQKLIGSEVSSFFQSFDLLKIPGITHTFLANLNENDEISLICSNKEVFNSPYPFFVVAGIETSVASSLTITNVG